MKRSEIMVVIALVIVLVVALISVVFGVVYPKLTATQTPAPIPKVWFADVGCNGSYASFMIWYSLPEGMEGELVETYYPFIDGKSITHQTPIHGSNAIGKLFALNGKKGQFDIALVLAMKTVSMDHFELTCPVVPSPAT